MNKDLCVLINYAQHRMVSYLTLETTVDSLSGTGSACTCSLADDTRLCELDCFFFAAGLSPGAPSTDLIVGLYRTLSSKSSSAND